MGATYWWYLGGLTVGVWTGAFVYSQGDWWDVAFTSACGLGVGYGLLRLRQWRHRSDGA